MSKTSNKAFRKFLKILFFIFLVNIHRISVSALPEGFVYINDIAPDIILEPRYYSEYNFVGKRIEEYNSPAIIMAEQAAKALKRVSDKLKEEGYTLKIWDAYRPQRAVDHFVRWAKDPKEVKMKNDFFPNVDKDKLMEPGYIAEHSAHTRGSAVDITIVNLSTNLEVDMGCSFDFFGKIAWHGSELVTKEQAENRKKLREVMEEEGFEAYLNEWWHYTLKNEPFPDKYFDFPVE